LFIDCNQLRPDHSIDVTLSNNVSVSLKIVYSSFLTLFLIYVIENELEVLARGAKVYLIFSTIELIVQDLWYLFIDKGEPIYDIEHAPNIVEFAGWIHES
jgi:hypothetical protein